MSDDDIGLKSESLVAAMAILYEDTKGPCEDFHLNAGKAAAEAIRLHRQKHNPSIISASIIDKAKAAFNYKINQVVQAVFEAAFGHELVAKEIYQSEEISDLKHRLEAAQVGLLIALDFKTATPEGLFIKEQVRGSLRVSGYKGNFGEQGSILKF